MLLSVTHIATLTPAIRAIRLAATDGSQLPAFTAGAHIELHIPLQGGSAPRKYSLVSDPDELSCYQIAVKRNINGRGGSDYLHHAIAVGATLEAGAPSNEFSLATEAAHHIFIAGGIGITPMLGLATAAERAGLSYELHYTARSEQEMAFQDSVSALSKATLYFSESVRLNIAQILDAHKGSPGVHVYVCGPARLIDEVRLSASAAGFAARHIHFESFGPAWSQDDGTVRLALSESAMELSVAPGTTLLDAMEAAGAWIPSECKRGECGACITSYSGGMPLHRDNCLTGEQRAHSFCPCVSWADPAEVLTLQI